MDITQNLYWERFRPQTLEQMALPDRTIRFLEHGIQTNMIFTGSSGQGKTTAARILTKNHPTLLLSAKLGVDMLRDKVRRFCQERAMSGFMADDDTNTLIKVVYFEEFDRASRQLQEELKSFIEEYSDEVRFLATTNTVAALDKNLLSRFNTVDFTPLGTEETMEIKKKYLVRILAMLAEENLTMPTNALRQIIQQQFPDFRKIWQDIQYYILAGVTVSSQVLGEDKLYLAVMSKASEAKIWEYIMNNWADKTDRGFEMLGRSFFRYIQQNHSDKAERLTEAMDVLSEFTDVRLPKSPDPFITLFVLVRRYQAIFV